LPTCWHYPSALSPASPAMRAQTRREFWAPGNADMDEVLRAKRQLNAGSGTRAITIRGAREHNLKNIDVEIPRDRLAVFTGLSGSGKSSLAFDTIYAEGQRRYVESLSAYARQFLEMMQKPDVDQIDVVVDRIVVRPDIGQRLAESFETALKLAEGLAVIEYADAPAAAADEKKSDKKSAKIHDKSGPERILFSEKFACPVSGFTIPEIEPRLFSFNNPYGACPACGGLGVEQHIDEDLVIPDKDLTLRRGAIAPWAKSSSPYYIQTLS